ncbi:YciI family protein [Sciscionella marina]|uniref:YciI family protein n=1 Tax=Sciscionella marina TaxID=508770 RepID=UPI000380B6D3|nr:YciI family protein [Sciscionella marina]
MKYLLLIYSNPRNWAHPTFEHTPGFLEMSEDERAELLEQDAELERELSESGEFVTGVPLADPVHTRTARVRDGLPATTDGPYVESKEALAGYFVLDCASMERAVEIAERFPDARFGGVEVHPIMEFSGQEM